jgi:uncharacterized protein (TIGR03546 family)
MNLRRWFQERSLKLLAIRGTPEAIAGGVAIGIFFGFTPLFGLKTLGAMFFAWLTGCNLIAAVLAATLHDIILPLMPVIYRWEYDVGYWLLSQPHHWPQPLLKASWEGHQWRSWVTISRIGKHLLVGSVVCSAPLGMLAYFVTRSIVVRHRRKHPEKPAGEPVAKGHSGTEP